MSKMVLRNRDYSEVSFLRAVSPSCIPSCARFKIDYHKNTLYPRSVYLKGSQSFGFASESIAESHYKNVGLFVKTLTLKIFD